MVLGAPGTVGILFIYLISYSYRLTLEVIHRHTTFVISGPGSGALGMFGGKQGEGGFVDPGAGSALGLGPPFFWRAGEGVVGGLDVFQVMSG